VAGRLAARLSRPELAVWRRRAILIGIAVLVVVATYMFWFRDSSLVAVHDVRVEGVTANEDEITSALEKVGREQSTLHIHDDQLVNAVSRFPTVAAIKADATIPHKLTITVTERPPVAAGKVKGQRVAVSGDGYVLLGVEADTDLPTLDITGVEGAKLDSQAAAQAEILGAAPDPLKKSLVSASWDEDTDGVVVDLDGAPELRFGDGSDAEEKWAAVAAVLADPDADVPGYLDVSVPSRPVSGG
jgi:cell division septal protein FtsQ